MVTRVEKGVEWGGEAYYIALCYCIPLWCVYVWFLAVGGLYHRSPPVSHEYSRVRSSFICGIVVVSSAFALTIPIQYLQYISVRLGLMIQT